jgi:hypothetical protein
MLRRVLREALQQLVDSGQEPPNLRRGTAIERCAVCRHYDGSGECMLYGWPVRPTEVCDDFEPAGTSEEVA